MKNIIKTTFKVFGFLFKKESEKKAYKLLTYGVSMVLFFGCMIGMIYYNSKDRTVDDTDIETVYVCNECELTDINVDFFTYIEDSGFKDVKYIASYENIEEIMDSHKDEPKTVFVNIKYADSKFDIRINSNEETEISKYDLKNFTGFINDYFLGAAMNSSALSPEQAMELGKNVSIDLRNVGSDDPLELQNEIIKLILYIVMMSVLLTMCTLHVNAVTGLIITDKTNKLIETLMISMNPICNMTGKILAVCAMAIMQFALWGASLILGVTVTDYIIDHSSLPGDVTFRSILENHGFTSEVISVKGLVLALIFIILGLMLYIAIAAFMGSFADKLEDTSITNFIIMIINFASFGSSAFCVMNSNAHLTSILRCVPFTAPFILPTDLIVGSADTVTIIISFALLIITTVALGVLASYIYRNKIVNKNGNPFLSRNSAK